MCEKKYAYEKQLKDNNDQQAFSNREVHTVNDTAIFRVFKVPPAIAPLYSRKYYLRGHLQRSHSVFTPPVVVS
jgi:hypothetical protein